MSGQSTLERGLVLRYIILLGTPHYFQSVCVDLGPELGSGAELEIRPGADLCEASVPQLFKVPAQYLSPGLMENK